MVDLDTLPDLEPSRVLKGLKVVRVAQFDRLLELKGCPLHPLLLLFN
jgi:hypothetical protein